MDANQKSCTFKMFKPWSVYTDKGLLELDVHFVGIGKFADTKNKIALLLELQKKMRVLLELAKKWGYYPDCCLTLPSIGKNHSAALYPLFLQVRGVPSYFFVSLGSTLIFFCKFGEYPHIFLQVRGVPSYFFCKLQEYPHIFLQILGAASSFFLQFKEEGNFFLHLQIYQFLQTEQIRAWSYPVRTRFVLPLIPLFQTSGDVCPGFLSLLAWFVPCIDSSGATPADLLLATIEGFLIHVLEHVYKQALGNPWRALPSSNQESHTKLRLFVLNWHYTTTVRQCITHARAFSHVAWFLRRIAVYSCESRGGTKNSSAGEGGPKKYEISGARRWS